MTELDVKLVTGEAARFWRSSTTSPEAYDLFLRGQEKFWKITKEDLLLAYNLIEQAVKIDPNFALGWTYLGFIKQTNVYSGWSGDPVQDIDLAESFAQRAIALNPELAEPYTLMGNVISSRWYPFQLPWLQKAVEKNPNSALSVAILAGNMAEWEGLGNEALELAQRAMRLNPYPPDWYLWALGTAQVRSGHLQEGIDTLTTCTRRIPDFLICRLPLMQAYYLTGRKDLALQQGREAMRINPSMTTAWWNFPEMFGKEHSALFMRIGEESGIPHGENQRCVGRLPNGKCPN